jgi:receptor-binding and translocation channel-forming TcA subunit of Tc toxin
LKTDCSCTFETPEWFFNLTYPGHYRRRIKAVRLTIPCVVGPYANVGATLRLIESHIRKDPQMDSRVSAPLRNTAVIATSLAQSDAGVFEFTFRDERYMPFEGAGVDGRWELTLPRAVKAFDYSTISDVILRISYVAQENDVLRISTEDAIAGILATMTDLGVTQTWSLRSDFPDAWSQLAGGEAEITINIQDAHLPFFMSGFELKTASFDLLTVRQPSPASYPALQFDDAPLDGGRQ